MLPFASSGHQTEAEVNALIQTAIAGLITRNADQDGVILQNTLDIASLKTKTAANETAAGRAEAGVAVNAAEIRQLRAANAVGLIQKIAATGAGANAYLQLPEGFAARFNFLMVSLTEAGETRRTILSVGSDLDADTAIPLRASGSSDLRFTLATRRIENWDKVGNSDLVITGGEFFAVGQGNIKPFAQSNGRLIAYADLAEALQARINASGDGIPDDIARLAHDLTIIQHPEGVWERVANAVAAVKAPFAALFTNAATDPNTINQEPETAAVKGYAIASRTAANFVRRHADPDSDDNAWPGITPYAAGQFDLTTPANQKNRIFSAVITQMAAQRAAVGVGDATEIMLQIGDNKLIRFNQRGLEASIGQTAGGTAQTRAHFARYDSHLLPHISNTLYNNNIASTIAGHNIAALPRIKLTAKQRIADEQFVRRTSSVIVVPLANTAPTNFAIPIEGQQSIVGTLQYNAGNKAISYRFTSGHNVPGENFTIDFAVEITETITLPNGTVWGGMLAAESLSHPEFFQRGYKNIFIVAFVKVHDEPDSPNNLMQMVYRINGFTHTQQLHQTRAQLGLDSASVKLISSLQYATRIQISEYEPDQPPSEADLLAMDANTIGWGQIVRNSRADELLFNAVVGANKYLIRNEDGSTRDLREAAPWAVAGSVLTVPPANLPVSAQVVSGILLPRVITVPHFTAQTADIDLGFKLDGEGGLRSQFEELVIPVEYKVGRNPAETGRANHRFHQKFMHVALDALPAESSIIATGARWDRYLIIDAYPNTLQRIALHIWQENQRQGNILNPIGNIHINLVYQNNSDGKNYLAPLPAFGNVGHYDGLSVAAYHDPNARQVYLMPRNAAIQGEKGVGVVAGGARMQALVKKSAADFDTEWATIEGIDFTDNLLSSPITTVGSSPTATRTIDLTGAKAVVVVCFETSDNVATIDIIPINQLSADITKIVGRSVGFVNVYGEITFPNKTATANAQIKVGALSASTQIKFVGKITA